MTLGAAWGAAMDPRPCLGMLRETYELALEVAGPAWPTPAKAVGNLFERGVAFLEAGGELAPIVGAAPPELLDALNRTRDRCLVAEAQYAFARYLALVLTRENEALDEACQALADQHRALRTAIVACRREEERLKRELAELGASTVPMPEHDELPEVQPGRPRKSEGMYADLFEGASTVEVDLEVDSWVLATADRLARLHDWHAEWGEHARLVLFAHGLALALRQREADGVDPDDAESVKAAYQAARERVMGLEGRYATLKYRLFELRQSNRVLSWRVTASRAEIQGLRSRLELFHRDRARLEAELAARRSAPRPAPAPLEPPPPNGWRARLARLFTQPGRDEH